MGDTQIIVGGFTFTFHPSDIASVGSTIESKKTTTEIAGTGPMSNRNYDFDGTVKVITIKGTLTDSGTTRVAGYTVTTKLSQKQWLESLINGMQDEITLVDDYEGQSVFIKAGATAPFLGSFTTTKAMVGRITFGRARGLPNVHNFDLTLEVGQA